MHKKILIYFILLIGYNSYSQSDFEKGYIINNSDNKTPCLIRVSDWFSSPINFEYKLTEESKPIKITTKSIKEFSSLDNFKYERQTVDIDRSSNQIKKLNYDNTPKFIEETLFLEVLVEGKATLYKYEEGNLIRYFFKTENQPIEQLIYKRYKSTINSSIKENNQFKQQLYTSLSTSNRSVSSFENIDYTQRDLLKIFEEFNNESGSDYTSYNTSDKRLYFNVTVKPGINFSSFEFENSIGNSRSVNFDNKTSFRLGAEIELYTTKAKTWSIFFEPTYQSYNAEKDFVIFVNPQVQTESRAIVDYKSVELPLGIKYHIPLSSNTTTFLSAAFISDIAINSTIQFDQGTSDKDIESGTNFMLGAGLKFKDYSIEAKYYTSRSLTKGDDDFSSDYNTFAIVLGYSIL